MDELDQLNHDFEEAELNSDQLKAQKIAKEKKELLSNVVSGNMKTAQEKVAFILNNYCETRNSDIELAWQYWSTYESDVFDGQRITKEQLKKLTRTTSLTRARAMIQNEYKLFQADDLVKKYRGVLEEEKKIEAIKEKPSGIQTYSIFIDESGKTENYLVVGSLWIVQGGMSSMITNRNLTEWAEKNGISFEFHFAELSKHRLQNYKDFFMKFLSLNPTIGFKVIIVQNNGFRELGQPLTDLTFHLIHKGILHEHDSGRATLPRTLQVWLDEDAKGSDMLKLENLKERINAQQIEGLYLENFETVNSKNNFFIQAVDLFTASVNRKLRNEENGNIKDELANFILNTLKFDMKEFKNINSSIDNSIVFNLSHHN